VTTTTTNTVSGSASCDRPPEVVKAMTGTGGTSKRRSKVYIYKPAVSRTTVDHGPSSVDVRTSNTTAAATAAKQLALLNNKPARGKTTGNRGWAKKINTTFLRIKVRSHCARQRASTHIAYSWANQSKCPIQISRTLWLVGVDARSENPPLTSSNINQFSKFFHCQNQEKNL